MNATRTVVFLVYVNDFVIKVCDYQLIEQLKKHINTSFHMKDFGTLQYFLNLKVCCCSTSTLLQKHKYTQELLTLAILKSSNLDLTPIEVNLKLQQKYQQLIRSLNYFTITWPHISFIIQQVSQFIQAPRHSHPVIVRYILRYLKGTSGHRLFFSTRTSLQLMGFSDTDSAGYLVTRRSITGWCMFLSDSLISCPKYCVMSSACFEIVWLQGLQGELGIPQLIPTLLHTDNTIAIQIVVNLVFHEHTKHIEVDCYSIVFFYQHVIAIPYIFTKFQTIDVFTKALSSHQNKLMVNN